MDYRGSAADRVGVGVAGPVARFVVVCRHRLPGTTRSVTRTRSRPPDRARGRVLSWGPFLCAFMAAACGGAPATSESSTGSPAPVMVNSPTGSVTATPISLISDGPLIAPSSSAAWPAPSGIVVVSEGTAGLFLVDLGSGRVAKLTDVPFAAFDGDWAPDGSRLVFRAEPEGNSEIFAIDADGDNIRNLTNSPAADFAPAWSPDGKLIAFASDRSPSNGASDIFVMAPDGTEVRRVTGHAGVDEYPDWSPDSNQIVFSGGAAAGANQDIYVVDSDGTNARNLTNTAGNENQPAWSPDGRTIAFNCAEGTCAGGASLEQAADLFSVGATGTNYRVLADTPADERDAAWSLDGRLITYLRYPGGRYVMNADGSNQRPMPIPLTEPGFVEWRPPRGG